MTQAEHIDQLAVRDLTAGRAGRAVLSGVSFTLGRGEALLVRGANGSGKSSLLRTIAGLSRPIAGGIALSGEAAEGDTMARLARAAHYLGHLTGTASAMTVAENAGFAARLLDGCDPNAALARVGLAAHRGQLAARLSAGERRRLALARLLIAARPIWVLDEPTAGLDSEGLTLLSALIAAHRQDGGIVVAASHGDLALPGAGSLLLNRALAA